MFRKRTLSEDHKWCLLLKGGLWPSQWMKPSISPKKLPSDRQMQVKKKKNSPGKNTRVGCHFLLQGIFPTQGSNPHLLHCRQIPYHLSHQGSPRKRWEVITYKIMKRWEIVTYKNNHQSFLYFQSLGKYMCAEKARLELRQLWSPT